MCSRIPILYSQVVTLKNIQEYAISYYYYYYFYFSSELMHYPKVNVLSNIICSVNIVY